MNLHEYQAKQLFLKYNLPVLKGYAIESVEEALVAIDKLGGDTWIAKVQIHAGGRGKSGGVKAFSDKEKIIDFIKQMIGTRLVTNQTDRDGQLVNKILIESSAEIKKELYLSGVIDRDKQSIVFMASSEGGMDIEKNASNSHSKIFTEVINPVFEAQPHQGRNLAFQLGLEGSQIKQFVTIFLNLARMFKERNLDLLEINPLAITKENNLYCLDAKVSVDDNALYKQTKLAEWRDLSQEDEKEARATEKKLNYIALQGNIGCMVNGAGLAMAVMDIIKMHGGHAANFLDVGGDATQERVSEAFKIILSDSSVKGIFVNIFGGIVRCDMIANGIINAIEEIGISIPIVVRLEGTNSELGIKILKESNVNVIAATSFTNAAKTIIAKVNDKQ